MRGQITPEYENESRLKNQVSGSIENVRGYLRARERERAWSTWNSACSRGSVTTWATPFVWASHMTEMERIVPRWKISDSTRTTKSMGVTSSLWIRTR